MIIRFIKDGEVIEDKSLSDELENILLMLLIKTGCVGKEVLFYEKEKMGSVIVHL